MRIGIIGAMEEEVDKLKADMDNVTITSKASMDFYEGETVAIVGVSILAVVSFAWNIILLNKNANLEKGVAAIQEEKQIYYNYWIDSFEEIAFYDEYVVFVEDNNTNLYHKYNCSRFGDEVFWAYNIDAAIDKGYDPCPICCD